MPGCVKTHGNISIKNAQIVQDDPNGAFYTCPGNKTMVSSLLTPTNRLQPRKLQL